MMMGQVWRLAVVGVMAGLGGVMVSCKVGPNYERPAAVGAAATMPTTFKSATTQESSQGHLGRDWWVLYKDAELTGLEALAMKANQDIQAAMSRVAEAREATRAARSQFYPQITANPSLQRGRVPNGSGGGVTAWNSSLPVDLSYEVDVWGRVKRAVESQKAQFQGSVDDLDVVRQAVAADVAQDYFVLRSLDVQDAIYLRNVGLYQRQVDLVKAQLKAGLVGQTDVAQAQTQLDSTRASEIDVRRQRADLEHGLAILTGRPPAELALKARGEEEKGVEPPAVPVGLPVELLRRRPDVAEAEQSLVAASANIGVAKANMLPTVKLTGMAGFESTRLSDAVNWEQRIWSIGPSVSVPIFEGGLLEAQLAQAKARYDELQANYRTTVLGAFRDVEDSLTDLHMRADEAEAQAKAVASSREYLRLSEVQYKQGLANYLLVIDADRTLLSNELSAAQIQQQRMVSSVLLMKAMGGGWDAQGPAATEPTLNGANTPARGPTTRGK